MYFTYGVIFFKKYLIPTRLNFYYTIYFISRTSTYGFSTLYVYKKNSTIFNIHRNIAYGRNERVIHCLYYETLNIII